jgi:hypothetical protein
VGETDWVQFSSVHSSITYGLLVTIFRLAVAFAPPPMQWELVQNVTGNQGNWRLNAIILEMIS